MKELLKEFFWFLPTVYYYTGKIPRFFSEDIREKVGKIFLNRAKAALRDVSSQNAVVKKVEKW